MRPIADDGFGGRLPPNGLMVFAAALLAQWPLLSNPGYFSHDELQWAAFAEQGRTFSWLAIDAFQYRPLTFNLWLWLSRHLFEWPQAFHAVLVAWGSANAAMLHVIARRFGVAAWPAALGALSFALGPYAAYVHGWIGTLADLIWLSCALLTAWCVLHFARVSANALLAAVLTAAGLLAKEAALAIPALLAVVWAFDGRKQRWTAATAASGAVALAYLCLRSGTLLYAPREGAQYALSLAHVPLRWIEYQLYLPITHLFEVFNTLARGFSGWLVTAAMIWIALLAALWRAGPRFAAAFLFGGLAALAPVLLMGASWNQYAYGFAAVTAIGVAAAWQHTARWGRIAIALCALLNLVHGAGVMRQMREVGEIQARFSPALARALEACEAGDGITLRPDPDADAWIFTRLTHDIPSYDGVLMGDRIQLVDTQAPAHYVIQPDGRLLPSMLDTRGCAH